MVGMNRSERIQDLKHRMVAKYGSCLIAIPEDTAAFPAMKKDDTPEERAQKLRKKQLILDAREAAYKMKVPEMLSELDRIIARIKAARPDPAQGGVGVDGVHSTSAAALSITVMCDQCGNRDPNNVITDGRRGDRICAGRDGRGCGAILQDHIEIQGADRRNFEGEDDRRQFGPAPNKLLGDAANMETSLNIEMRGTGKDNSAWKRIQQAQQSVEMGLSSVGKEEKHTREGYKTGHKRKAFAQLEVIANDMNIHMQVVQRAKEEFSKYRDVMEAVHNFEGVLLACLVLAFEDVSASSSLFERLEQKFVPLQDSGDADNTFGHVRPRAEVTEDVAICAVPSAPIGKFTLDQVREWLTMVGCAAVGGNAVSALAPAQSNVKFEREAEMIYKHLADITQKEEAADAAVRAERKRRELPQSSIFGTVTVSSRLKRYRTGSGNASTTSENTVNSKAGLHLLRVHNISTALSSATDILKLEEDTSKKTAETYFREAVIRRSQYDATLLEYERITALQKTRIRIEDHATTNFQASVLQPRKVNGQISSTGVGGSSYSGSNKVSDGSAGVDSADVNQAKRPRLSDNSLAPSDAVINSALVTNPTAANANTNGNAAAPSMEDDIEFDLEDLVGGPIPTASSTKYANITKPAGSSNNTVGIRSGAAVKTEPKPVTSVNVKIEGTASAPAGAAAAPVKKVGMKPRPKFVIS